MGKSDNKKYVFTGSRGYVLEEMLRMGLNITRVWVMEGSFLHHTLEKDPYIDYEAVSSKKELLDEIEKTEFDVLVSNGCEYILPISRMKKALYVNVHPSYLPDLKGRNPINAAFLYDRDCGATCHLMDDGIDTGQIISRIRIPVSEDIDAAILYRLCFKAEVKVFAEAYSRRFVPMERQPSVEGVVYYSLQPDDRVIHFEKGFDYVLKQVRAFGYKSKGLYFYCNGKAYRFYRASEIRNPYVLEYCKGFGELQAALVFDDSLVFRLDGRVMRFDYIEGLDGGIQEGAYLQCADS